MSPNIGFIVSHPRLFASERWERLTTKLTSAHGAYKGRFEDWLKQGANRLRAFPAAAGRASARAWNATRRAAARGCARRCAREAMRARRLQARRAADPERRGGRHLGPREESRLSAHSGGAGSSIGISATPRPGHSGARRR